MKIPKILIVSFLFACIGITTEVVFTSFSSLAISFFENSPISWALTGKTYFWMFFIYALIPFIFKGFNLLVEGKTFAYKIFLAVVVIYLVEFSTGLFLKIVLGACPWEYTTGLHVMGLIRLDYFPAWILFAALVIYIYEVLDKRISE